MHVYSGNLVHFDIPKTNRIYFSLQHPRKIYKSKKTRESLLLLKLLLDLITMQDTDFSSLTISVLGLLLSDSPCFFSTTSFNFSSSQESIVSSLLTSSYKDLFSAFLSIVKSCENLHLSPFLH